MRTLPPASLIICSRNRPVLLADAVESVLQGNQVPSELVIVDQSDRLHPSLSTVTGRGGCTVRYVWTHSRGLSRAMNHGIALAAHDLLVFTHDDVLVPAEWFGTIVRALQEAGQRALVTGQVRADEDKPAGFQISLKVSTVPKVFAGRAWVDPLFPMNMAMYRASIEEVGGFDERLGPGTAFPAAEDNEFGFRALEHGHTIHYVPEAIVYHRAWRSSRQYVPLWWDYGIGQGAFYAKHLSLRDPYVLLLMLCDIRYHGRRALGNLVRARRLGLGYAAYVLGVVLGAVRWMLSERGAAGIW